MHWSPLISWLQDHQLLQDRIPEVPDLSGNVGATWCGGRDQVPLRPIIFLLGPVLLGPSPLRPGLSTILSVFVEGVAGHALCPPFDFQQALHVECSKGGNSGV